MASILYGALVSDLAGKVGGQNFQRGLASPVLRNISTKRNFQSVTPVGNKIVAIRGLFSYVVASWRGLSSAQQAAWSAAAPNFPRYNKFGTSYTPSAYQLFVEFSLGLKYLGEDLVTGAPAVSSFVLPVFTVTYSSGPGTIVVSTSGSYPASNYTFLMRATRYLSNGVSVPYKGFKLFGAHTFTFASPNLDITSLITGVYGPVLTGSTMYIGFSIINRTTGEEADFNYQPVQF